ncbi:MAG: hypothetical protein FGM14_00185 [Flavobacteriales bacterium]|nr:hypothetical protein [Flavobacteriales bacterium]
MNNENNEYQSIPFIEFYEKTKGSRINLDFEKRIVEIYDNNDNLLKIIHFSVQIDAVFDVNELLLTYEQGRKKVFFVYENGNKGLDWLWYYGDLFDLSTMF